VCVCVYYVYTYQLLLFRGGEEKRDKVLWQLFFSKLSALAYLVFKASDTDFPEIVDRVRGKAIHRRTHAREGGLVLHGREAHVHPQGLVWGRGGGAKGERDARRECQCVVNTCVCVCVCVCVCGRHIAIHGHTCVTPHAHLHPCAHVAPPPTST